MSLPKTQEEALQRRMENRLNKCVHFNGTLHEACKIGIRYDDDVGRDGMGIACLREVAERTGATCAQRRFMTAEEAALKEREMQAGRAERIKDLDAADRHLNSTAIHPPRAELRTWTAIIAYADEHGEWVEPKQADHWTSAVYPTEKLGDCGHAVHREACRDPKGKLRQLYELCITCKSRRALVFLD